MHPCELGWCCTPSLSLSLFFSISQRLLVRVRKRESERERKRASARKPETERGLNRPKRYSCARPPPLAVSQQPRPVSSGHCHQPLLLWPATPANQRPNKKKEATEVAMFFVPESFGLFTRPRRTRHSHTHTHTEYTRDTQWVVSKPKNTTPRLRR